jgi:hypothetical protein
MKKLLSIAALLPLLAGCAAEDALPEADSLPAVKNFIATAAPEEPDEVVTYADVIQGQLPAVS